MIEHTLFYILAALLLLSATMVIMVRNPVYAALFLVLAFFFSAGIWLLLQAEFLAIALILVYVGAVMVLFLFVIMMLDINLVQLKEGFAHYLPVGILVAGLTAYALILALNHPQFEQAPLPALVENDASNTEQLGLELYQKYLYPFEIAGALLLVAIIAAISLTHRGKKDSKQQNPSKQVNLQRQDRVKLVSMSSSEDQSS